jgi:C4-dicarboxylate-specific signal transduction histidine kinase
VGNVTSSERRNFVEQLLVRELTHRMELAHVTRITTPGELAASIAHEVNQPLAGVVTNAEACLNWLDRKTPDLEKARRSVEWVIQDGNRATEVIRRVRALANKTEIEKLPLDVNDVAREVISLVQRELVSNQVSLRMELAPALPTILGDRVQLQQVIINLVTNSIEAMQSITDRPRELAIRSRKDEPQQVLLSYRLRHRHLRRGYGSAVHRLLHHQIQRHGNGALNLQCDHGGPRWPPLGHGKRVPRCHVSAHPAGVRRHGA